MDVVRCGACLRWVCGDSASCSSWISPRCRWSRSRTIPLARLRSRGRHGLRTTLRALHEAAGDPRVVGLIAKVGGALPWAGMQELRLGVRAFSAGGKPTLAWAQTFDEAPGAMAGYVLATAFDEVWLQPGGDVGMLGVGVQTTFVRGALDRLGIEPQLDQRYEFKNAADQIMRTEFTQAHRAALDRLAESVFTDAVDAIAQGRELDSRSCGRGDLAPEVQAGVMGGHRGR